VPHDYRDLLRTTLQGGVMNRCPLRVEASRDEKLSRWLWLVKWLLLIPHYLVLAVLWVGFVVLTLTAYVSVLFTGRYPRSIFAYNTGVLRWNWRVSYYGYQALGTDRYPPFTLADVPQYPAQLRIEELPRPPRWLPLVAWLFAVPHILLLSALTGAATWRIDTGNTTTSVPLGVVSVGILIAGLGLLLAGRYPRGLYDLLLGIARWNLRVLAYLALLTPAYPPFRLDQGDREPDPDLDRPVPSDHAYTPGPVTRPEGSVAGPVTALVAGAVLLIPAGGLGTAGGALLAFDGMRDRSGYVTSPVVATASSTAAVTAENITIQGGDLWSRNLADIGGVRLTASGTTGKAVFIGIARQSAIDGWLSGTARDRIVSVPAGEARYERTNGVIRSVSSPSAQDFWLASATGTTSTTLQWQVTNGDFTVVVANADGSVGVAADVRASAQIPDLSGLGAGLLAAGVVLALLALGLIIGGGVGLGRRHSGGQAPAPGPPQDPPPAGPAPEHVTDPPATLPS
jgi:hypothetical protein